MRKPAKQPMIGKWRITGMDMWDADFIDLEGPGYIRFDPDGRGELHLGSVQVSLHCRHGKDGVRLTFAGTQEMDGVSGAGDARLQENGTVAGEIRFHDGDDSDFTARRWGAGDR